MTSYGISFEDSEQMYLVEDAIARRIGTLSDTPYGRRSKEVLEQFNNRLNALRLTAFAHDRKPSSPEPTARGTLVDRVERLERELSREVARGECNAREIVRVEKQSKRMDSARASMIDQLFAAVEYLDNAVRTLTAADEPAAEDHIYRLKRDVAQIRRDISDLQQARAERAGGGK